MSCTNRFSTEYQGVRDFLNLAKQNTDSSGRIRCPCKDCNNCLFKKLADVKFDLFRHGFAEDYTQWAHQGESFQPNSDQQHDLNDNNHISEKVKQEHGDMFEMLDDIQKSTFIGTNIESSSTNIETVEPEGEVEKFRKLLNDAQRELYPSCKYSKLSFLMKMIHNKTITNSSIKSFDLNLKLFKDALPKDETLPESYYEVKKLLRDLAHEPYQQFEPGSNDVHQTNIESNELLNKKMKSMRLILVFCLQTVDQCQMKEQFILVSLMKVMMMMIQSLIT
ncbi:hypothetical protein F3Y22_tig00110984pilonHSYRG00083 [Hibiscus syriacus]|uniref:Transposase-associated domain-containing protein n=1 Tax=Hibiscus syriacus TaxID=106335 RepID=A0A6A2Z9B5_HIBSY|nr:hypothetical protein F3Y22_tig00110984pilonHSYRG00083 [Hibiscus syriacus]